MSFMSLGPLWGNVVSSPEFNRQWISIWSTFGSVFGVSGFLNTFRFVPRRFFSQLSLTMDALGEPMGSSGDFSFRFPQP